MVPLDPNLEARRSDGRKASFLHAFGHRNHLNGAANSFIDYCADYKLHSIGVVSLFVLWMLAKARNLDLSCRLCPAHADGYHLELRVVKAGERIPD